MRGEILGLEIGENHSLSAEAIADSTILVVKRTTILTSRTAMSISQASFGH
jgi:CRP-like cAMP-binding protein